MSDLEIRSFLTISTGHVSRQTGEHLEESAANFGGKFGEYGWFIYCTEDQGDMPDDLFAVCQFARSKGCAYVLLDRDAEQIDDLPFWEW